MQVSFECVIMAYSSPANNRLNPNTYNFVTDCNPTTFCNPSTSICEKKGCRRDIVSCWSSSAHTQYPYGYAGVPYDQLPPLCPEGQLCVLGLNGI